MKQRVINGHALEFFDSANTKKGEIKISGSNIIINPLDANGTVIFGEEGTVNDIEVGAVGTPVDFTFAGGGTITSNGGTLTIGNSGDTIDLSSATIGAITASAFVGGTFEGNGAGLTNVVPDLSAYNGNVSITGSLRVTGRVTAEEFHTEYVSASILYQSGSTKFGDTFDDVHDFTGSINLNTNNQNYYISGSNNILRIGSKTTANKIQLELYHAANPVSLGIDYNGGQALPYVESVHPSYDTNTHLLFKPGGTENWRIGAHGSDHAYGSAFSIKPANSSLDFYLADSSGTPILYSDTSTRKVGIGVTSPTALLDIASGSSGAETLMVVGNTGNGNLRTRHIEGKLWNSTGDGVLHLNYYANEDVSIAAGGGNVMVGGGTATARLHVVGEGTTSSTTAFKVENSNGSGSFVVRDNGSVGIGTVSPDSGINLQISSLASNGVEPNNDGRVYVQIGDTSTTRKAQLNFLRYSSVAVGAGYMIPETNSPHLMWSEGGTPNQEWRIDLVGTSRPYYEKFYPQNNPPLKEFGFASGSGTTANGIGAFTPSMLMHYGGDIMVGPSRTTPSARLHVSGTADVLLIEGSGSTANTSIFAIDGNNGRLFEVSDDLSDSLFSVNTIAGLPVMEVFSDNRITMGAFNQNDFVISGSRVGIGTDLTGVVRGDLVVKGDFQTNESGNGQLAVIGNVSGSNVSGSGNGAQMVFGGSISATDPHRTFGSVGGYKENDTDGNRAGYLAFGTRQGDTPRDIFERMRIDSTGNVGIGAVDPNTKLDIRPEGLTGLTMPTFGTASYGGIHILPDGNATSEMWYGITFGNTAASDSERQRTTAGIYTSAAGNYGNKLYFATSNSWGVGAISRMMIDHTGNVGINTTSPQEKLHISGSVRIDGNPGGSVQEQAGNSPTTALTNGDPDFYMGIPDTYLKIVIDGTAYIIPAYSPA